MRYSVDVAKFKAKTIDDGMKIVARLTMQKNSALAEAIWTELVDQTPVDTGTARVSWIFSVIKPSSKKPPIAEYSYPSKPNFKRFNWRWRNWYITNNQDYISDLNNGSSKQNTNIGWVDSTVNRNVAKANGGGFDGFG